MDIPLLAQIYVGCAGLGTLFLLTCAFMGAHGTGHGHIGAHGGGAGHSGSAGGHGHIGHGGGHAGGHAGHAGGHSGHGGGHTTGQAATGQASGHGHASGHGQEGAHSQTSGHQAQTFNRAPNLVPADTSRSSALTRKPDLGVAILTMLNPTSFASFFAWFGIAGVLLWHYLPILPLGMTIPVATACGVFFTKLTLDGLGWVTNRMFSSVNFTDASVIGHTGEVTVVIPTARIGEIMVMAGGTRETYSARSKIDCPDLKRGASVIIVDLEDGVALVEPWADNE